MQAPRKVMGLFGLVVPGMCLLCRLKGVRHSGVSALDRPDRSWFVYTCLPQAHHAGKMLLKVVVSLKALLESQSIKFWCIFPHKQKKKKQGKKAKFGWDLQRAMQAKFTTS